MTLIKPKLLKERHYDIDKNVEVALLEIANNDVMANSSLRLQRLSML